VWLQAFVLDGECNLGAAKLRRGSFMHRPAGVIEAPLASAGGALLYVKLDGFLDFKPA
jgi:hypothetical protein